MTTGFLLLAALMIGAALAFVLVPLLRRSRGAGAPIGAERKRQALKEALDAGVLDAAEYAAKLEALNTQSVPATAGSSRAAFISVLAVALLLPASAVLLYRLVGTPQALDPANLTAPSAADHAAGMEQAIAGLADKLRKNPDDVQGWSLLGRAYQATNQFAESREAFKQAHDRVPDDVDITVEYAQAIALAENDHRIDGEPRTLLEGVLTKDPTNQRALWLIGIADYQDAKYDTAIATWEKLLSLVDKDSDVARSVRKEIADAKALREGRTPPSATASADEGAPAPGEAASAPAPATAAGGARLTVSVHLDPKLKDRFDPNATLFVFARAASGPPMPLAIQRLKAGQLPTTVTLDDSMGMMPTMKLSMFPQVVVGARISKSGNALPQSGDLQTLTSPLDVHRTEPIDLDIDQVVP